MKIVTDKAVYVQKNDIMYLYQSDLTIPGSIFIKVFGNGTVIINDDNRYEFIEFNEPDQIKFFQSLDWMIDFDEVKDLSEAEIIDLGQKIASERNSIAQKFNSMSPEEKEKNADMVFQCDLLDFKMYSLRDIYWLKQGKIQMTLPEGIEFPTPATINQEKGIKRLIKTLFNKNKNK